MRQEDLSVWVILGMSFVLSKNYSLHENQCSFKHNEMSPYNYFSNNMT